MRSGNQGIQNPFKNQECDHFEKVREPLGGTQAGRHKAPPLHNIHRVTNGAKVTIPNYLTFSEHFGQF